MKLGSTVVLVGLLLGWAAQAAEPRFCAPGVFLRTEVRPAADSGPRRLQLFQVGRLSCTPERSVEIVNRLWGENGITVATRLTIARKGAELGRRRSGTRARLQALMN